MAEFLPLKLYPFTLKKERKRYLMIHCTEGFRPDFTSKLVHSRAREIDKCKSVQPFHKQSAISVSFMETTDRPFPRSWKLPIGSFRNDRPFPNIR